MGQRLVITIHAFDEDIATIYYHWSAYTTSALDEAQKILKNVKWEDTTSKDELILRIVRFMESMEAASILRISRSSISASRMLSLRTMAPATMALSQSLSR